MTSQGEEHNRLKRTKETECIRLKETLTDLEQKVHHLTCCQDKVTDLEDQNLEKEERLNENQ